MPSVKEFDTAMRRHVLDAWFPRCLDTIHGGFLCDFDRSWASCGPHEKLLEFQARQTLLAADACLRYAEDPRLREAALHGLRYLGEVMWDGANGGGWFHRMDRAGQPLASHTKHAHGAAYAIEACVAVHEATGDPAALRLAQDGFGWLDRHARDPEFGGYFGFLTRDNLVIRDPADCPWGSQTDTIGTEIGLKDANVHSDLLETFVRLYRVWPDARVGERLAEVLDIMSDKMLVPSTGALHIFVTPDWRPIPHLTRAGYQCQAAYRLTTAIELSGDAERLRLLAGRLLGSRTTLYPRPAGRFPLRRAGRVASLSPRTGPAESKQDLVGTGGGSQGAAGGEPALPGAGGLPSALRGAVGVHPATAARPRAWRRVFDCPRRAAALAPRFGRPVRPCLPHEEGGYVEGRLP